VRVSPSISGCKCSSGGECSRQPQRLRLPPATSLSSSGFAFNFTSQLMPLCWFLQMNEAGVDWFWHDYARTPHGFALAPDICTEYTEAADRRSTQAFWALLAEVWPDVPQLPVALNACGTAVAVCTTATPSIFSGATLPLLTL
jgi:hypothetical protein